MDNYKRTYSLLPQILELLTHKISLTSTVDDLCKEIQDKVPKSAIQGFDSLKSAVQFALKVGEELGIIALEDSPAIEEPKKKFMADREKDKDKTQAAKAANTEARLLYGGGNRKKTVLPKKQVPSAPKLSVKLARLAQKRAAAAVNREPSDCATCLKRHRRFVRK